MSDGQVVITAPLRLPERYIKAFVSEHWEWIAEKRASAEQKLNALTAERDVLLLRGKEYAFRLSVQSTKKPGVTLRGDQILVSSPTEDHQSVRAILEKWYRQQAKKYFTARVPLLADLVNRDVKTVRIGSPRSRWGSCSSRLTIALNWRLLMAPDSVSDYVIYHELAHLTHMNHSKKFWDLVAIYHISYKDAEKWLKDHHSLLQF